MTNDPVDLDDYRGKADQVATNLRRQCVCELHDKQAALQRRQKELEDLLFTAPAMTWPEAAAEARYLLHLFAETPEAQGPFRKELIARAIEDLNRTSQRGNKI